MKYWKGDRHWDKVSSCCHKDNPLYQYVYCFHSSAMVILSILYDFTMMQLSKIVINLKSSWLHQARAAGIRFNVLKLCYGSLISIHDILFFQCKCSGDTPITKLIKISIILSFCFQIITNIRVNYLELWFSVFDFNPWNILIPRDTFI
jgi:hypothetical protein